MTYVNIQGRDGLVRDLSSGAILNTNRSEYENFLAKRQRDQQQNQLIAAQNEEINNLKAELGEIKELLKTLVREQNG